MKGREPLYGLCQQLNVYGNTPFADLSGSFPASSADALDTRAHGFTTNQPAFKGRVRSCVVVDTGCGIVVVSHHIIRGALGFIDGMSPEAGRSSTDANLTI